MVNKNASNAQDRMERKYNEQAVHREFKVDDKVLVFFPRSSFMINPKLNKPYVGPARIKEQVGKYTYKVTMPNGRTSTVHANRIKPFLGSKGKPESDSGSRADPSAMPQISVSDPHRGHNVPNKDSIPAAKALLEKIKPRNVNDAA